MKKILILGFLLTPAPLMVGCGPEFPNCNNSADCQNSEKGKDSGQLICVNGRCQQCLEDADCNDPSLECNAGSCDKIQGYCTSVSDCGANMKCESNRCQPECSADSDCPDGQKCDGGKCTEAPECSADDDCPAGSECDGGKCVTKTAGPCSLQTVYFAFDSSTLEDGALEAL